MKSFLMIMALTISLGACKTTKTTLKEDVREETTVKADVKTDLKKMDKAKTVESVTDKTISADSVVTSTVIVKWSDPDTAGRQYPVESTYINQTALSKKDNDIRAEKEEEKTSILEKSISDNTEKETTTDKETRIKEKKKPAVSGWLVRGLVITFFLALIAGLYIYLKKPFKALF